MKKNTNKPALKSDEREKLGLVSFVFGFFVFLYRRAIRP